MSVTTLLCLLAIMCAMSTTTDAKCNVLRAAYEFEGNQFFINGDGMKIALDGDGDEVYRGTNRERKITAAVGYAPSGSVYNYLGVVEKIYPDWGEETRPFRRLRGSLIFRQIFHHAGASVDAAYIGHNDVITYFGGCDYIKVDFHKKEDQIRVTSHGKNDDLGLPCDLDAAWSSSDHRVAYFVKGDQLYQINDNAKATGPVSVVSIFPALSVLNLCPNQ